jgi:hypothetical protein
VAGKIWGGEAGAMSVYQEFQENKTKHETRIWAKLNEMLQDFRAETGAPVYGLDLYFDGATMGDLSRVLISVKIRTEDWL